MLDIFLAVCTAFVLAMLLIFLPAAFFVTSLIRRDLKEFITSTNELIKRYPTQIKRVVDEQQPSQTTDREYTTGKKNVTTVPEIDPSRFSAILKNPPRAPGGFGVVIKNDQNKGSSDKAGDG